MKLRWYQYRLRTLLLLVLIVSIALSAYATITRKARRQRAATRAIVAAGGLFSYDFEYNTRDPKAPGWLRKIMGDDMFSPVSDAVVTSDDAAANIRELPELEALCLRGPLITDEALKNIE